MNSRRKGKAGELELAHFLTEHGWESRRGVQFKGGPESPDVIGLPGIHIECKRVERLDLDEAMEQSIRDSGEDIPVVMHRKNRKEWKVTMRLEDWLKLYERWKDDGT